jgi:hypothetical protein
LMVVPNLWWKKGSCGSLFLMRRNFLKIRTHPLSLFSVPAYEWVVKRLDH